MAPFVSARALALLAFFSSAPGAVSAQDSPGASGARPEGAERATRDAAPPSLALRTDRARAHPHIALVVDPAAAIFGAYGLRVGFALGTHQAIWLFPSFQRRFGRRGAALELSYAVMPLGRKLEGLRLAISASAARFPEASPLRLLGAGAEAGYAHVWGKLFLGGAAGAARRFMWPVDAAEARPWELVVRAELGLVFL